MPAPALLLFIALLVLPIALALWRGDRLVDALSARRRQGRSRRRRRATRALPVREDAVGAILAAEENRDRLEERIAATLSSFARLRTDAPVDSEAAEALLAEVEDAVLRRESRFGDYLDCAWLQSETIELLDREVRILRDAAGLRDTPVASVGPSAGSPSARISAAPAERPEPPAPPLPSAAARRLMETLEAAARRRVDVDRRLQSLQASQKPAPERDRDVSPGSRIDFTISDEE